MGFIALGLIFYAVGDIFFSTLIDWLFRKK